jgi:hypothetical protein
VTYVVTKHPKSGAEGTPLTPAKRGNTKDKTRINLHFSEQAVSVDFRNGEKGDMLWQQAKISR